LKWKPFELGDKSYDLSHLDPFSVEFVVEAKDGKPAQSYQIEIEFSMHCFTREIRSGDFYSSAFEYSDSREARLFDEDRYQLSKRLPEIVRNVPRRKVFHGKDGNFCTVEKIPAENGARFLDYEVFFKISRSRDVLNLYVQSGYIPEDAKPLDRSKPVKFSTSAFKVRNRGGF
jgi:hypothetical protein